jgi:hypothetical protein
LAEQIVRLIFVAVVLALPVLVAWAIARGIARRRPPEDRPKLMRRALTLGAAGAALLAMGWLSGLFVDREQQHYEAFFDSMAQGSLQDCRSDGHSDEVCRAYCLCYRDALGTFLGREEVAEIRRRLEAGRGRAEAVEAVREDYRPAMEAAAARCRAEAERARP